MPDEKKEKQEPASEEHPRVVFHVMYGRREIKNEGEYQMAKYDGWTDEDPHAKAREKQQQSQQQHQR